MNLLEYLIKSKSFLPDEMLNTLDNEFIEMKDCSFSILIHQLTETPCSSVILVHNISKKYWLLNHLIVTKGKYL